MSEGAQIPLSPVSGLALSGPNLLEVDNVVMQYPNGVQAVAGVSIKVRRGETLAIVGESGCGKSTLARVIMRILVPSGGRIMFDGENISRLGQRQLKRMRARFQMVFQDPYASLNPRQTIRSTLESQLSLLSITRKERQQRVEEIIESVGLDPTALDRLPHEFSGGQRQRIGIARACIVRPDLLVCDEPVSALDVSIRAQILNLLLDMQRERGITMLFISHDMSVVRHMADSVAVMYLGRIVEISTVDELFSNPRHPYTAALLLSVPVTHPRDRSRSRVSVDGDPPSQLKPPSGCSFHPRCSSARDLCRSDMPTLRGNGVSEALVACHFPLNRNTMQQLSA